MTMLEGIHQTGCHPEGRKFVSFFAAISWFVPDLGGRWAG